jgi:hypothetical protein
MASFTAIIRSGYYVIRMFPSLMWAPINMRRHLGRATDAFENQLLQSGINREVAQELAETYRHTNKELISQLTSPRSWNMTEWLKAR